MTREQAVAVLIQQVITPMNNPTYIMAAGPQTMLNAGDIVQPVYFSPPKVPGTLRNIQGPTWFFWVDTDKWAKFGHLVYFVYIDATNPNPTTENGIIVDQADDLPQINGVTYRDSSGRYRVTADIVYGTIPTTLPPD